MRGRMCPEGIEVKGGDIVSTYPLPFTSPKSEVHPLETILFYVQPIKIYNVKVILISIVKIKNVGLTFGE